MVSAEAPLSAIDWLSQPGLETITTKPTTPAIVSGATTSQVNVQELDPVESPPIGLIPAHLSGIPTNFWTDQPEDALNDALTDIAPSGLPASHDLFLRALLSETEGDTKYVVLRARALIERGAVHAAHNLLGQINIDSPDLFTLFSETSLLVADENRMCRLLLNDRNLSDDDALLVFCMARIGDWDTAVLRFFTLDTISAFEPTTAALLSAFLDPDIADEIALPKPSAGQMSPLEFKLRDAIGRPVPTHTLPLKYAVTDLAEKAGWKSQLDAAERLAIMGSLSARQFLEIYNQGRRSASGGVWERVDAVQRLAGTENGDLGNFNDVWNTTFPKRLPPVIARALSNQIDSILTNSDNTGNQFRFLLLAKKSDLPIAQQIAKLATFDSGLSPEMTQKILDVLQADVDVEIPFRSAGMVRALGLISQAVDGNFNSLLSALELTKSMGLQPLAEQLAIEYLILDAGI